MKYMSINSIEVDTKIQLTFRKKKITNDYYNHLTQTIYQYISSKKNYI